MSTSSPIDELTAEHGVVARPRCRAHPGIRQQALLHLLDEIVLGLWHRAEQAGGKRLTRQGVGLLAGQVVLDDHPLEGDVATQLCRQREPDRVVADRVADDASQQRGLGRRQLVDALVEVRLGGRLDPVRAVAEVDGVEVALEDLGLGELPLQADGQHRLPHLAADALLGGEE